MRIICALCLCLMLLFVFARPAGSHELEPKEAGHPLKVAAHVAHPAGYILYHGVARPVHWFMSLPGLRHVFGHTEDAIQEDPWESRTSH